MTRPLTSAEAALVLGCTPGTVRDLARRGELAGAFTVGGRLRVPPESIDAYKRAHAACVPPPTRPPTRPGLAAAWEAWRRELAR